MSRVMPSSCALLVLLALSACGIEPQEEAAPSQDEVAVNYDELGSQVPCQWFSSPPGPLVPYGPIPNGWSMVCNSWAFKNTTVALYNSSNANWALVRVSAGFWYADYSLSPGQQFRFERFYAAAPITIQVISPNGTPAAAAAW